MEEAQRLELPQTALVLSGGGARGAYQVGVLQGLLDQGFLPEGPSGIGIFVGSSAGSINAALLAAHADHFARGVAGLVDTWSQLEAHKIFRTDIGSMGRIGVRWAWDLSFGGALGHVQPKSLLDTAPLRELVVEKVPFRRIDANIEAGRLRALAVPATDLYTANGVLFVHGHPDIQLWGRRRWRIERTRIRADHLMASSAIPIFFPSVEIEGRHFGDGSIRNTAPLSHAINLGARRVIAIGVNEPLQRPKGSRSKSRQPPTIAQIAGVLLDAVMLDAIEVDVEHSERVNTSVLSCATGDPRNPFRWVDVLWLRPSREFGSIATELSDRIPAIVHYLMRGLGSDEAVTELASYLLFDSVFCTRLIELGRADVAAERERIAPFFNSSAAPTAPSSGASEDTEPLP
jgi:NTE family protein